MQETVIVTIQRNKYCEDFELPSSEPLKDLYPRLCSVLKKVSPSDFDCMDDIVFEVDGKGLIDGNLSLNAYGISNGIRMDVVSARKYYGVGGRK